MSTQFGSTYGLCAIGNAIVDILAPATQEFIQSQKEFGMQPGSMALIDAQRAEDLYKLMGPATEASGGSAGNTMAAYASFGGKGAYIGKVADDQLGKVFTHDIRAIGVHFDTAPLLNSAPTAQCLILVTDDAQRTMNTFLGASVQFAPEDVNEEMIANSEITYLEGYLFDAAPAKTAFFKAAEICAKNNRKLALTLSDPFCVNRHRDDFKKLVEDHVDILFSNEDEIKALYEVETLEAAIEAVRGKCDIVAITCGAQGSIIVSGDQTIKVEAAKPLRIVDTTGAGDVYAAGFLFGLTEGKSLKECGDLGSLAAAEVIDHYGPRPAVSLKDLMQTKIAA
ncbi:MAG: adenosine kinase [Micavibrio aeruginosavorus]|uniref:Adenosine kinase n=1 Tax=Micavibrio aeruginosavorus TaxID=349221 RepID=A0A2W5FM34_9BACT|nr:MAG: adenosine kinase [Micavibrio aeruginosavorus]